MYWLLSALLIGVIIVIIRWRPVRGLSRISIETVCHKLKEEQVQILDVRDPVDYEKSHIREAINIYVGRLPYVNKKELQADREIVLVSSSDYQLKKAARILKKAGFQQLSGVIWMPKHMEPISERRNKCCCA